LSIRNCDFVTTNCREWPGTHSISNDTTIGEAPFMSGANICLDTDVRGDRS